MTPTRSNPLGFGYMETSSEMLSFGEDENTLVPRLLR
jgi:hypothetical protein